MGVCVVKRSPLHVHPHPPLTFLRGPLPKLFNGPVGVEAEALTKPVAYQAQHNNTDAIAGHTNES